MSAELYQARVAAFAGTLETHIGFLLLDGMLGAAGEALPEILSSDQWPNAPTQEELTAQFNAYIREDDREHASEINGRLALLSNYARYVPVVADLKGGMNTFVTQRDRHNFLGSGSNSQAFLVNDGADKVVVRIPYTRRQTARVVDPHMVAGIRSAGVPGLEQIIAASYDDGVTVAHFMPGKEVPKTLTEDINSISSEHIAGLIRTVIEANRRRLIIDFKTSNIFFGPQTGFGIIDLVPGRHQEQSESSVVVSGLQSICNMGGLQRMYSRGLSASNDPSAIAHTLNVLIPKIQLYREVASDTLGAETREEVLRGVDEICHTITETRDQYADPNWVATQIRAAEERATYNSASLPQLIDPDNID